MRIARATAEDLDAVLRLEREVREAPHWPAVEYAATLEADAGSLQRCLLVCRRKDELVGFAVGKVVAGEAELETIAVRATERRSGVGRALGAAVIAWGWEQGAAAMELEVRASSAGARALYCELGFVEVGRRRGYYGEPVEDAVLMRLVRSEGGADGSGGGDAEFLSGMTNKRGEGNSKGKADARGAAVNSN